VRATGPSIADAVAREISRFTELPEAQRKNIVRSFAKA